MELSQAKDNKTSNKPETLISSDDAIEDLDYCIKVVSKVHPACIKGMPNELSRNFSKCRELISCTDSLSINEFHRTLRKCISCLLDAHTNIHACYDSIHYIPHPSAKRITAINGLDFQTFLDQKRNLYCAESDEYVSWILSNDLQTYEGLLFLGYANGDSIDITVENQNGYKDTILVRMRDVAEWETVNMTSVKKEKSWDYQFFDSIDIAYFDLRDCRAYSSSYRKALRDSFDEFFSYATSHDINNVVLNLCNNHGGNGIPRRMFMQYLPIDTYRICKGLSRHGPFMIRLNNGNCHNDKSDIQYHGKIFVLTSKYTFSGATMFADVLQGNGLATIVGETSSNAINCYSGSLYYQLPNSKLVLQASHCQYTRTNRTVYNEYVIPDVLCDAEDSFMMVRKLIGK